MSDAAALIEQALSVVKKHGQIRTSALALALCFEDDDDALDRLLEPAAADGRLITCRVGLGGEVTTTEYRLSISGGGKLVSYSPNSPQATPAAKNAAARAAALRLKTETTFGVDAPRVADIRPVELAPAVPTASTSTKGEHDVTFRDKVIELLKKHGPMTTRELRAHGLKDANASTLVGQLAARGALGIVGGGARSKIYGLPDQKIADRKVVDGVSVGADKARRSIHKRRRAKPARHARKRAGGGSVAMRRKPALKRSKRPFRPALAADGAILLLGAKRGDFEIPREQARALVDINRRLTGDELADLVMFVTRLDNAEVGA